MTTRIIGGQYKNRTLATPKGESTRPTSSMVREAVFNICQHIIEGSRFLDLFAGCGAMGIEAVSRGAASATCVESHSEAVRVIRRNIADLGIADQVNVYPGDAIRILRKLSPSFELIYADPPYENYAVYETLLTQIDQGDLLVGGGHLFLEAAAEMPELVYQPVRLCLRSRRRYGRSQLLHYTIQEKA